MKISEEKAVHFFLFEITQGNHPGSIHTEYMYGDYFAFRLFAWRSTREVEKSQSPARIQQKEVKKKLALVDLRKHCQPRQGGAVCKIFLGKADREYLWVDCFCEKMEILIKQEVGQDLHLVLKALPSNVYVVSRSISYCICD